MPEERSSSIIKNLTDGRLPQTPHISQLNIGQKLIVSYAVLISLMIFGVIITYNYGASMSNSSAGIMVVITVLISLLSAYLFYNQIVTPIKTLANAANRLAYGDLTVQATIHSNDEIGQITRVFNSLGSQLHDITNAFEERVQQRFLTFQASAEIGRQIAGILDLNELLDDIVNRMQTEFDLYYIHIYLVDEKSNDLVMTKGSGEIGKQLELQGHRMPAGQGIVGTVAFLNDYFLSNDVSEVINFIPNPLLPNTRSELAVPLRRGGRVLGVLDIQSEQVHYFSSEDVVLMQSIADQIAIAIDNARLYQHLEEALVHQYEVTTSYSRFVPREILFILGKQEITDVELGDQIQQKMTILFADIRSFTTISEHMTPEENFRFINAYLGRVSPIIREYNGFIDKYIGDAIMALFPSKADNAVKAAVAMQREVAQYNEQRTRENTPCISIGIGLHTGNVMLGTVGEDARMEGTVISDAVNLASRMEGLTKTYRASTVLSEDTLSDLGERSDQYKVRFLDRVKVKGKQTPVSVFEILDGEAQQTIDLKLETRPDFEMGLFHYQYQEFDQARPYFKRVLEMHPDDDAAALYLQRVNYFLEFGVPVDWEGVVSM